MCFASYPGFASPFSSRGNSSKSCFSMDSGSAAFVFPLAVDFVLSAEALGFDLGVALGFAFD